MQLRWSLLAVALAALAGAYAAAPADPVPPAPTPAPAAAAETHYVSPGQLADAGRRAAAPLGPVTAVAHDGAGFAHPRPGESKPLLAVFIKDGCPCSVDFEPLYHRLAAAYDDRVRFAGVIDGDPAAARRFAGANQTPYPVLADPRLELAGRLGATNGAYAALVDPAGAVVALWPGLSADTFREIGARLAAAAGVPERPLDAAGAPSALVTGCPYHRD